MKPSGKSLTRLAVTRSKAKMYEYGLDIKEHIKISYSLTDLINLTIAIIGDLSASDAILEKVNFIDVLFSAEYFDALLNARVESIEGDYLRLLGASAYCLAGYPGSAQVLISDIGNHDFDAGGVDRLIIAILKKQPFPEDKISHESYYEAILQINERLRRFFNEGDGFENLSYLVINLRKIIYASGSDRELLFADIFYSLLKSYQQSSLWHSLPAYSGLDINLWKKFIQNNPTIKELWPAQIMIGEKGIYKGESAIIQMPTSAGKTKSAELIIRSAFLGKRTNFAVIVAPFRALCEEIYHEMSMQFKDMGNVFVNLASDTLQADLENNDSAKHQILILTPEKLEFLLRHRPELAATIGLAIYDEGHLFDDMTRGTKYELLLASLKSSLSKNAQVILISAVMPNAEEIGQWLLGPSAILVEARRLTPTNRSVAFSSWLQRQGRLEFVTKENIEINEFFVPYLFKQIRLTKLKGEHKQRSFPESEKDGGYNPYDIALSLGCRMIANGSVAIFTGRKDSAVKIASRLVNAHKHGAEITTPNRYSNQNELRRFGTYISRTLGSGSTYATAAEYGIFIHHGNTPHGLRLAIEFGLQCEHIHFVICTSTLAQGINLPIRYLMITTTRQGGDFIKTRDFHNLMGRVGRAGKYTEGTVIFTDHRIYDARLSPYGKHVWQRAKQLLDFNQSEYCRSAILLVFEKDPEDKDEQIRWHTSINRIKEEIKMYITKSIVDIESGQTVEDRIVELTKNTLAYYQANDQEKELLILLFLELAYEVIKQEPLEERRRVFSKSVVNLEETQKIFKFLEENIENLLLLNNVNNILQFLWPVIYQYNNKFSFIESEALRHVCNLWISGKPFPDILEAVQNYRFGVRRPTIDHVVELCENGFGYNSSLVVGTCYSLLDLLDDLQDFDKEWIHYLQKMIKYGLPDRLSVALYELGFADRALSMEIAAFIADHVSATYRKDIVNAIHKKEGEIKNHIRLFYPSYFEKKLTEILS